ncbi:MAG: HopJ type III effector protein [Gallionella sp.]
MKTFLDRLASSPAGITFNETIAVIDAHYEFTPTAFRNGKLLNEAGQNNGSCKIFSFAKLNNLTVQQTLQCFGGYYRDNVLKNPQDSDHQNIRNFITTGWEGIEFHGNALTEKSAPRPNPLASSEPWNLVAVGYAETTMIVFEQFADEAIAASNLKPRSIVLDVACGPGTLSLRLAHAAEKVHGIDFSESMLAVFRNKIEQAGHEHIELHCGDAQSLPYGDKTFDAAFSLFGLMFFPDRKRGFAEIYRTLKPGGSIAVTSWAPVDQSPAMQAMFGALRAIKPDLPPPQRSIGTLENPEVFKLEMLTAGFRDVEIRLVTKPFPVTTLEEFWNSMVKGSAPIQMLKKNMGDDVWREKELLALDYLTANLPPVPTELTSDAWLGIGVK